MRCRYIVHLLIRQGQVYEANTVEIAEEGGGCGKRGRELWQKRAGAVAEEKEKEKCEWQSKRIIK